MAGLGFNVIADPLAGYFYKQYILGQPQQMAEVLAKWSTATTFVQCRGIYRPGRRAVQCPAAGIAEDGFDPCREDKNFTRNGALKTEKLQKNSKNKKINNFLVTFYLVQWYY